MNNKGFVFIETIISIVILMVSFLTIFRLYYVTYSSYQKHYYDDSIINIYKAYNTYKALKEYSNFTTVYKNLVHDNQLITNIGPHSGILQFNNQDSLIDYMSVLDKLGVTNVYLIKDIDTYEDECLSDYYQAKCRYMLFDNTFKEYIKSTIDHKYEYILIVESMVDSQGKICRKGCEVEYTFYEIQN